MPKVDKTVNNWKYNKYGHVEVTDVYGETVVYIQIDYEIKSFFEDLGINVDNLEIDETGTCPVYF